MTRMTTPAQRRRTIADRIRHAREQAGLTRQQAACRLDMTTYHYAGWERGSNEPTPENKVRLARLFECPVSRFYVLDDDA